jgi:hypothetical protein
MSTPSTIVTNSVHVVCWTTSQRTLISRSFSRDAIGLVAKILESCLAGVERHWSVTVFLVGNWSVLEAALYVVDVYDCPITTRRMMNAGLRNYVRVRRTSFGEEAVKTDRETADDLTPPELNRAVRAEHRDEGNRRDSVDDRALGENVRERDIADSTSGRGQVLAKRTTVLEQLRRNHASREDLERGSDAVPCR